MPANIVLVHDELDFLASVSSALRAQNYTVAPFSDPMTALKGLESAATARILVSLAKFAPGLPNGVALALMARQRIAGIKVLFLAGPEVEQFTSGIGELMFMPVAPDDIVSAVVKMLEGFACNEL